nr:hypothetical protein CFP56_09450 [Quercus suber]
MPLYLPTELLVHIFSFVDAADKATCAAICATNTLGRDTMRPILYSIADGGAAYVDEEQIDVFGRGRQLSLLCRTLVENSDLAGLVTDFVHWLDNVTLLDRDPELRPIRNCYGVTDVQYETLLLRIKDDSLLPVLQHWKSAQRDHSCSEGMHIVLLLLICPNLAKCTFRGLSRIADDIAWLGWLLGVIGSKGNNCKALCHLQEFRFDNHDEELLSMELRTIDALLSLPQLQTIKVSNMGMVDLGLIQTLATTNIQHLDLEGTHVRESRLLRRLSLCPRLCVLTLGDLSLDGEEWQRLGDVLRAYCHLLQILRLAPCKPYSKHYTSPSIENEHRHTTSVTGVEYLGSLRTFHYLRRVEASKSKLCGLLPPGRKTTVLSNCSYGSDILSMETYLPGSLEHFVVSCYTDNRKAVEAALQRDLFITKLSGFAVLDED